MIRVDQVWMVVELIVEVTVKVMVEMMVQVMVEVMGIKMVVVRKKLLSLLYHQSFLIFFPLTFTLA